MPSDHTRSAILSAAERLYADRGFGDVTLRDIVAAAMRRSLPDCSEVDLYWGLHFALAMAHQTIRDSERLMKLSEGKCDLSDVEGMIDRVVAVSVMALTGGEARSKPSARPVAPYGRLTRQDL